MISRLFSSRCLFIAIIASSSSAAVSAPNYLSKNAVRAYECDSNLLELRGGDRAKKIMGTFIRICFVPTVNTFEHGIGIENIISFVWKTNYGKEDGLDHTFQMLTEESVKDGESASELSYVTCEDDGSICVLQSMLPTQMYRDTGPIYGEGYATLTNDAGIVPVKRDVFHSSDEYFGEEAGQCLSDTNSLIHSNPELKHETDKYQEAELENGVSGELALLQLSSTIGHQGNVEDVVVESVLSISVPDGEKIAYKNACTYAGGVATELPDTVMKCPFFGQMSLMEVLNGISCLADTEECKGLDTFQVLIDAYEVIGFSDCTTAFVTEAPTNSPVVTEAPTNSPVMKPTAPPTSQNIIEKTNNNINNNILMNNNKDAASSSLEKNSNKGGIIAGVLVAFFLFVAIVVGFIMYKKHKNRKQGSETEHDVEKAAKSLPDPFNDENDDDDNNEENNNKDNGRENNDWTISMPSWSHFNQTNDEDKKEENMDGTLENKY